MTMFVCLFVELSPPKPLDQSKNVTVRTFHIWPGIVHEYIFLALDGARSPRRHVERPEGPYVVTSNTYFSIANISIAILYMKDIHLPK